MADGIDKPQETNFGAHQRGDLVVLPETWFLLETAKKLP
jgi:hypothetical protein